MEKDLKNMSYTDFIGFINQWNVLPGAYNTLSKWKTYSNLDKRSYLLEIACTTGFSSRELSIISGCSGLGIDISKKSIDAALKNKKIYSPYINIKYKTADAHSFISKKLFTHVVVGSGLGFFDNPKAMLEHIPNLLTEGGMLLASPFYVNKKIPQKLVKKAKKIFGINITQQNYKEIMSLYSDYEILFEERNILISETNEELEHYCISTLKKLKEEGVKLNDEEYKIAYDRLMEIKLMSNELRPYQGYIVIVLRYRKYTYQKRCVELF
jgi:ubiquinone/menaquinone biosynthesis C-methylase UbiE